MVGCVWLCACVAWADAPDAFVLAQRGSPPACALEVAAEGPSYRYAARVLNGLIEESTGVRLEAGSTTGLVRRVVLKSGEADLGTDGFSIVERDGVLTLSGGSRGIVYAVYELMERFGGMGWFASWRRVVPPTDLLTVPSGFACREKPAFALREVMWQDANLDPAFAVFLRRNYGSWMQIDDEMGGTVLKVSRHLRGHTFNKILPPDKYFALHPEWFSEIDGRRKKDHSQWCLSNRDLMRFVGEAMHAQMAREPDASLFFLIPNDWYDTCTCRNCLAIEEEEGSPTGPYVRFLNAVADAVVKDFPQNKIRATAYQWTRRPPRKTHLRPNILFSMAPIECDFSAPMARSAYRANRETIDDLVKWGAKASGGFQIFDYATAFSHYPTAFPNVYAMAENLRFYRDHNVKYIINEGCHNGMGAWFGELKAYVQAKLQWNPDRPLAPLLDTFFKGFYGPAAPYARACFELAEHQPRETAKQPLRCIFESPFSPVWTDDYLERVTELWDRAEEAVADFPDYHRSVRLGKISAAYMYLRRYCPMVQCVPEVDPKRAEKTRRLAAWMCACAEKEPELTINERDLHISKEPFFKVWRNQEQKRDFARVAVSEEDVFLFHEKGLWVDEREDPDASEGRAARIRPTSSAWCLQLPTMEIRAERGQRYRVRVRVKVVRRKGASEEGEAFSVGFSNFKGDKKQSFKRHVTGRDVTDGAYAWYDAGEWTAGTESPQAYFWLSMGRFDARRYAENPDVESVWFDQIAFENLRAR
jgi:hypothetical protein